MNMSKVVGIGQEVKGFKIGDRVSGEGHITCGHCRNCRGGRTHLCRNTTASALTVRAASPVSGDSGVQRFKIPDNISDDLASILIPSASAVHTALSFDLRARMCWSLVQARLVLWRRRWRNTLVHVTW